MKLSFVSMTRILFAGLLAILKVAGRSVGILASGIHTTPADDTFNNSIRGGDLNFRTGKFDDGTDPAGWYGRD